MRTLLHAPRTRKRSIAAATLGALALVGSLLVATPAQAINDTGTGGVFVPASGRVLDTKVGTGGFSTPMEAGKYRTIKIAGVAGIPDDGTVGAVSLNATVSGTSAVGTLFGRPDADTSRTTMLIYNDNAGEYVSNTAIVAVSAAGTIQVSTETAARLILDVQGYYTANTSGTAAGGFVPVAGKRIADTRSGLGAPKALLAPGKSVDIQVTGANGVPAGASGAVVNLLPINSTDSDGYLTPYATGTARPDNALHYAPSVNTSIQAQVRLSSSGKMTIYNGSSTINLVVDLQGYFTAAGTTGATFTPGVGRVFDSRASDSSIVAKNETRAIQVAGQTGVPIMSSGITAVVLTLTAVHGGSDGRASVWANGTTQPDTTALNFQADEIRTNTVTVALGANGKINLNNVAAATNYVIDVQGWYVNPVSPTITCDAPYADGSLTVALPTAPIGCVVTAPASGESNSELDIRVDGASVKETTLSAAGKTVVKITVPAAGGEHAVDAILTTATLDNYASASYEFETGGNWPSERLLTSPGNGLLADLEGTLGVDVEHDQLREYVQRKFIVSRNPDGLSDPIIESDWLTDSFTLPAGVLTTDETYYWTVTLSGRTSASQTVQTVTSSAQSFIADDARLEPDCVQGLASAGQTWTKSDVEAACVASNGIEEESEQEMSDSDIANDPDLTSSQKGELLVSAQASKAKPKKKYWKQWHDGLTYHEVHKGAFYYSGSRAWSTKKYDGVTGYHRCHAPGSLTSGSSTSVVNCYEQRSGKSSQNALAGEDYEVTFSLHGYPVSYVNGQYTICNTKGKLTKKQVVNSKEKANDR